MRRDSAVDVRQSHPMLASVVATGPRSYSAGKMRVVDSANRARPIMETRRLAVKCNPSPCGDAQRTATQWRAARRHLPPLWRIVRSDQPLRQEAGRGQPGAPSSLPAPCRIDAAGTYYHWHSAPGCLGVSSGGKIDGSEDRTRLGNDL